MTKRSHERVWRHLVEEAGEEEIERAASVSVAQAEKQLAEAGFDVAAERAKAEAFLAELEAEPPDSGRSAIGRDQPNGDPQVARIEPAVKIANQVAPRVRGRARWVWLAAAAFGALAVGLWFAQTEESPPVSQPAPQSPQQAAAHLRDQAVVACDRHAWSQCLDLLDKAQALDPEGDRAPRVQDLRRAAKQGLLY